MNDSNMAHRRHELLTDIADHIANILLEHKIDPDLSEQAGVAVSSHLSEHWAGQIITIPKDFKFKTCKRDLEIYNRVTSNNIHLLAREFNITPNAVYRIIKRIRKIAHAEKQPELF